VIRSSIQTGSLILLSLIADIARPQMPRPPSPTSASPAFHGPLLHQHYPAYEQARRDVPIASGQPSLHLPSPPVVSPADPAINRLPAPSTATAPSPTKQAAGNQALASPEKNNAVKEFDPTWKEVPALKSPLIKLSGFFHLDAGCFDQDDVSRLTLGDIQNGVGFRRARLQALGSVTEFTNYSIEMDFATAGRPSFQDVWLEQTHLPVVGNVRIGHFRQPFTMDSYTSIRQLAFLERSLPFQAFDPFRRTGMMAYDTDDQQLTAWQYSVYRTGGFNEGPIGDSRYGTDIGDGGGYSFATRVTRLLWYDEPADGRYLLHVGGNVAYGRNTTNDYVPDTPYYQARAIPEFFVGDAAGGGSVALGAPFFADTGRIPSEDFLIYGLELAGQYGPSYFQTELLITSVDQIGGPSLFYHGAYFQAGYFLTGENRTYNRTFGAFDKVVPFEDFFAIGERGFCGWGAWEVAARLSYVDLDDAGAMPLPGSGPRPGSLANSTLGLNWYWNAHAKLQFNWIHCWLDNATFGDSETDIYCARTQLEF
jgi:phosphate-selective porin OprO/OprP